MREQFSVTPAGDYSIHALPATARGLPRGPGAARFNSFMMKLARLLLLPLSLSAAQLTAQVAGPSPLVSDQATAQLVPGGWIVAEGRANAALQAGFPVTSVAGYRLRQGSG
jgi:hypothetical protein